MRRAYRFLSVLGTIKTARRGAGPLIRRVARQRAHRGFSRAIRKVIKP